MLNDMYITYIYHYSTYISYVHSYLYNITQGIGIYVCNMCYVICNI